MCCLWCRMCLCVCGCLFLIVAVEHGWSVARLGAKTAACSTSRFQWECLFIVTPNKLETVFWGKKTSNQGAAAANLFLPTYIGFARLRRSTKFFLQRFLTFVSFPGYRTNPFSSVFDQTHFQGYRTNPFSRVFDQTHFQGYRTNPFSRVFDQTHFQGYRTNPFSRVFDQTHFQGYRTNPFSRVFDQTHCQGYRTNPFSRVFDHMFAFKDIASTLRPSFWQPLLLWGCPSAKLPRSCQWSRNNVCFFLGHLHYQLSFLKLLVGAHQIRSCRVLGNSFSDLDPSLSAILFQGMVLFQGAACGWFLGACLFQGSCRLLEAHGFLQLWMPFIFKHFFRPLLWPHLFSSPDSGRGSFRRPARAP